MKPLLLIRMHTAQLPGGHSHRQSGFSLIEVLVSILLISVGLLGIAGLSGATFGYNKVSQLRLTGISLVNDFADRARVNVYGFDLGGYSVTLNATPASNPVTVSSSNLSLDPSIAANAKVLANDLAAADVDQFLRSVAARLPQGRAVVVSRPAVTTRDMDIWLLWQEPQTTAGDTLFGAGQGNCPNNLSAANQAIYSCMYFKVAL